MIRRKVKILLADAQFLTNEGIKSLIRNRDELEMIGEASNSSQLFHQVAQNPPHILIFDYHYSNNFEHSDLQRIREIAPNTQILLITSDQNKDQIFRALEWGVLGILTKECDKEEIINAIFALMKKEKFLCSKVVDLILEKQLNKEEELTAEPSILTKREVEIVELIGEGMSTREIADRLFLSHHTINTHRKNIMKKLQLRSPLELVLYGINTGIIKPKLGN